MILQSATGGSAAYNHGNGFAAFGRSQKGAVLIKRILIAIPALALLFAVIYFHGVVAKVVAGLVAALCIHEMMGTLGKNGAKPIRPIGYAYAALLVPAYEFVGGFTGVLLLTTAAAIGILIVLVVTGRNVKDGLATGLPMLYPGVFWACFIAVVYLPKGASQFMLLLLFAAAVLTDTFAYFTGMLIGKHKLIERISPKKTVEGAIGAAVFGAAGVTLFGAFAQASFGVDIPVYWYAVTGVVLSVLSQIGDLAASLVKRHCGIKDYGHIMGPHGGAMDRLDSVLFISPAVYAVALIAGM